MGTTPARARTSVSSRLPEMTGRSLHEWVELVRAEGPPSRRERVAWLQDEHHLEPDAARLVASKVEEAADAPPISTPAPPDYLEAQYAGPKATLFPIYKRLSMAARLLGRDVQVEARKTYVSIARNQQFAIVQATSSTRVDLGLRLPGVAPTGRLKAAGSFGGDPVTHRVSLSCVADVDTQLLGWLKDAYTRSR